MPDDSTKSRKRLGMAMVVIGMAMVGTTIILGG